VTSRGRLLGRFGALAARARKASDGERSPEGRSEPRTPRAKRATRGASDGERSPEGRSEPRTLRDTRPGTPGWNLHKALEVAAVEGGRQIVEGHVKHRKADYAAWCRRVGA
jgi:hypothetical protein